MKPPHECPDLDLFETSVKTRATKHEQMLRDGRCHIYEGKTYCVCPEINDTDQPIELHCRNCVGPDPRYAGGHLPLCIVILPGEPIPPQHRGVMREVRG